MGALAAQSSLAASVQSFRCQFSQDRRIPHDSASTLAPSRVSLRRVGFARRSTDGTTEPGTGSNARVEEEQEISPKVAISSPFAGGKISSRLAAGKAVQQREIAKTTPTSSSSSSPPSVLDSSDYSKRFPSPPASPFSIKNGGSVSSDKKVPAPTSSSVAKPSTTKASKAFPAPAISSPFDKSPLQTPPRKRSTGDIDERILASRKEILDTLWKERRQQPRMVNAAPADIFDDPKPSESDKEYKFELIRGTRPIVLIISFSLIAALMFGTAFVAWKLGAFHYDEL
ncbi:putative protein TPRXL [Selaginella moellendorffii]|uniref:putative protein TPRXL n=1 Tax=Selaginella moellendorffii TaxID=88036 RepID=UPI000D1C4796|nr:putative protein TPRXL [Selaginella moellendorffii]XP_024526093.1 putative protein TPRXL [Selaginella moellendorffii]|eukprot:XP_024526091.1 putative protein TPRXL [Selaginella moellendorffii]